jgi:serine/threonine protein kinase
MGHLRMLSLQGDLKAGNVLLQHSIHGSYGQVAKISDFGLSTMLLNGCTHRSTASLGTITAMPPELLRNGRLSPSSDVYSFGILSKSLRLLLLLLWSWGGVGLGGGGGRHEQRTAKPAKPCHGRMARPISVFQFSQLASVTVTPAGQESVTIARGPL